MKKPMLWMLTLATLSGSALFPHPLLAQNIVGTWQGTLQTSGRELRVQIRISTTAADSLKAVLYNVDQPGPPIPVSAVNLQGTAVKMTVPGIGGTYEGKLNADGNSMTGTWTQGPSPLPLNLTRANSEAAWAIPAPPKQMPADARPVFEVATIKPGKPEAQGKAFRVTPGGRQVSTFNTSVSDLITFAYGIHARQIAGAPAWLETEKYDVLGKPDLDGQPSLEQFKGMVQKLLADRFRLAFHREKKDLTVYAIVVGKTGPKLTKSEGDPNGLPSLLFRGLGILPARNATIADFAGVMQGAVLDRPVVDQTGLAGRYDFTLTWTPDESQFGGLGVKVPPPSDKDTAPDLYTAIQRQLGLKLESTRAPVDVLVIDHVEKPSEN